LREWKWFFSLKEAHFYPGLLQLNSSLRIAWVIGTGLDLTHLVCQRRLLLFKFVPSPPVFLQWQNTRSSGWRSFDSV
jgi:hypothetical protein